MFKHVYPNLLIIFNNFKFLTFFERILLPLCIFFLGLFSSVLSFGLMNLQIVHLYYLYSVKIYHIYNIKFNIKFNECKINHANPPYVDFDTNRL